MKRPIFPAAAILLALALLLGGSGTGSPWLRIAIEIAAVAALVLAGRDGALRVRPPAERAVLLLLALALATPLAQLVPLPYDVWSRLPGRDLAAAIDRLAGGGGWHPLTLDPEATRLAAVSLLPPAAMLLLALRLDEAARARLAAIVVGCALLSALAGMLQAAGSIAPLHEGGHRAYPTGLFANRNHHTDLLLIAIVLSAALIARRRPAQPARLLAGAVAAALAAGVVATTSRMGLLLLPLALAGSLLQFRPAERSGNRIAVLGTAAGLLLGAATIAASPAARRTLERFDGSADARLGFWADAGAAAQRHFPWGSGIGTFQSVYGTLEDLNRVGPSYVNHAHNDYLQLVVEAGLWGGLLALAGLALFAWLALRRIEPERAPLRSAAAVSILILLLHSAVDYPLRMPGLLVLFALLWTLMLPAPAPATPCRTRRAQPPS